MARNSLFSTYRGGENRVTSSMLAVFQRMEVTRLESLLEAATGDSTLQLVSFSNQPGGVEEGVPDGLISGDFAIWIETKTSRGQVRAEQLRRHARRLDAGATYSRLLVITPDVEEPPEIQELDDDRVIWVEFRALGDAIDAQLRSPDDVIPDREAILLYELHLMLEEEGLLDLPTNTVVVAARRAYAEYLKYSAYICQPGRSFRPVQWMGFYRSKRIEPLIPRVTARFDQVEITHSNVDQLSQSEDPLERALGRVVDELIASGARPLDTTNEIFLLTRPEDKETVRREDPIEHLDSVAWTMGQRYTFLEDLRVAKTTADLR